MDSKPEIILVDDEQEELSKISGFIKKHYAVNRTPADGLDRIANLRCFNSGSAALEYYSAGNRIDFAFLDIIMPGLSGVETALRFRANGFMGYIVFLTSSNDFAAESYAVEAFSYLLKPVEQEKFFSLMQRLETDFARNGGKDGAFITVKTRQYDRNILFRELVFIEVIGHKLFIHLANKEILTLNKSLNRFAVSLMDDGRFAYCHNASIVNLDYVKTIKNNVAVLKTGQIVPISRRHNDFKTLFISRSIRKTGTPQDE
jgi:two-component system response regulator LytT